MSNAKSEFESRVEPEGFTPVLSPTPGEAPAVTGMMLPQIPVRQTLRDRRLFLFLMSELVFSSGVWSQTVVLSWLAFELTRSEVAVAAFTAARLAPLLLGPLAGALSDRWNRVHLLGLGNLLALSTSIALGLAQGADMLVFWLVVVAGFMVGASQSALQPVRLTFLYDLVGATAISSANALNNAAMMGARIAAPAVAGWLIANHGVGSALWFGAAWFVPAGILLRMLRDDGRTARAAAIGNLGGAWASGFRAAAADIQVMTVIGVSITANLFAWPIIQGLLPIFAEEVLDIGPDGLGILFAASGLGSLIGAVSIAALGNYPHKGMLYVGGTALFGLSLAAFAVAGNPTLAIILMFVNGLVSAAFGVMQGTLVLLLAPPAMRGRVMGVLTLSIGVLPLATLMQGALAATFGVVATTAVSGVLLAVVVSTVPWIAPGLRRV